MKHIFLTAIVLVFTVSVFAQVPCGAEYNNQKLLYPNGVEADVKGLLEGPGTAEFPVFSYETDEHGKKRKEKVGEVKFKYDFCITTTKSYSYEAIQKTRKVTTTTYYNVSFKKGAEDWHKITKKMNGRTFIVSESGCNGVKITTME